MQILHMGMYITVKRMFMLGTVAPPEYHSAERGSWLPPAETVDVFDLCIKTESNECEQCVRDVAHPFPPAVPGLGWWPYCSWLRLAINSHWPRLWRVSLQGDIGALCQTSSYQLATGYHSAWNNTIQDPSDWGSKITDKLWDALTVLNPPWKDRVLKG